MIVRIKFHNGEVVSFPMSSVSYYRVKKYDETSRPKSRPDAWQAQLVFGLRDRTEEPFDEFSILFKGMDDARKMEVSVTQACISDKNTVITLNCTGAGVELVYGV